MPAPTPTIGGITFLNARFPKSMQSANQGAGNCVATAVKATASWNQRLKHLICQNKNRKGRINLAMQENNNFIDFPTSRCRHTHPYWQSSPFQLGQAATPNEYSILPATTVPHTQTHAQVIRVSTIFVFE